jgi:hypothetical protein
MMMTEMVLKVLESNPNAKQFRFKTLTVPKLNKKSRATGEACPYVVTIESEFTASLGVNYQDEVNRTLAESGQEADFRSQKPAGKHYVNGTNWLMEADKTPGKFYVALSRFDGRTTRYLSNGTELTPEQAQDLKDNYMAKASPNAPVVEWKTYSVESIVSAEPLWGASAFRQT